MSKAQLVITAVVLEGRSKSEVARDYDVSRYWVQQLVRRYETEGAAAFEPHSRRPHHNPPRGRRRPGRHASCGCAKHWTSKAMTPARRPSPNTSPATPAVTKVPAVSTIWRILTRRGFVTPQPQKRPRSSWKRFEADLPNQCWQADVTHWRLADPTEVEILNIIDDHSRLGHRQPRPTRHHRPRRRRHLHHGLRRLGHTGSRADRQRRHLHRQTPRRRAHRPTNPARRT